MAGNVADIAIIGGVRYWAGGPYAGKKVDETPANAGDLTPYLNNPQMQAPSWTAPQQTQAPTWAAQAGMAPPRVPWQDVLEGRPTQNFNPGGAFGAGRETLPSAQRFNRLSASEQQGYSGYLQDHLKVNPDDVFGLMQKLKPQAGFSSAPRWAGGY